jgi:hypothetical protein
MSSPGSRARRVDEDEERVPFGPDRRCSATKASSALAGATHAKACRLRQVDVSSLRTVAAFNFPAGWHNALPNCDSEKNSGGLVKL